MPRRRLDVANELAAAGHDADRAAVCIEEIRVDGEVRIVRRDDCTRRAMGLDDAVDRVVSQVDAQDIEIEVAAIAETIDLTEGQPPGQLRLVGVAVSVRTIRLFLEVFSI